MPARVAEGLLRKSGAALEVMAKFGSVPHGLDHLRDGLVLIQGDHALIMRIFLASLMPIILDFVGRPAVTPGSLRVNLVRDKDRAEVFLLAFPG